MRGLPIFSLRTLQPSKGRLNRLLAQFGSQRREMTTCAGRYPAASKFVALPSRRPIATPSVS
jgi:hypothetical protein